MTAWWRTRRGWRPLCALAVCASAAHLLQTRALVLPIAFGTDGLVLGSTFLPLVWALGVADCFASTAQAAEVRPGRRLLRTDTALMIGLGVAAATALAALAGPHATTAGTAGHALFATGIAGAIAMRAGAGAAALALCTLLMTTTLYGVDAPAGRYVRVLQPDGDPTWALMAGATCFGVAVAMSAMGAHRPRLGGTERFDE